MNKIIAREVNPAAVDFSSYFEEVCNKAASYIITRDTGRNRDIIEIRFDTPPTIIVVDQVRARYRWDANKSCWYTTYNIDDLAFARCIVGLYVRGNPGGSETKEG